MIRRSRIEDLDHIMDLIMKGSKSLKDMGIDQWQNGYPSREQVENDLHNGNSYVAELDGKVVGTMACVMGVDPNYNYIEDGEWLYDDEYSTIHRITVDPGMKNKGIGQELFNYAKKLSQDNKVNYMRIDTHGGNIPMQKFIKKMGYDYRGIIYVEDGGKRSAYELKI